MTCPLIFLSSAILLMAAAAIDYSDAHPFAWVDLLCASYATAFLAGVL